MIGIKQPRFSSAQYCAAEPYRKMTIFIRRVLVGVIGAGTIASSLAAAPNVWLKITAVPELGILAQVEEFRAVRSLKEWNALTPDSRQAIIPIDVDFTKYTLLVAALGTRPSGGYTVTIRDARDDGTVVHVSVLEIRPRGPDCAATALLTYPTTAALIPRTDKAVRFEIESADLDCRSFRTSVGG
jgi:PrcB C-terminal